MPSAGLRRDARLRPAVDCANLEEHAQHRADTDGWSAARFCCKVGFPLSYRNNIALNSLSYIVAKCVPDRTLQQNLKWRLWHGQVRRGLDLIAETMATLKVTRLLGELETYVYRQSDIIIDYATARRREEPISTAVTKSTVRWLVHRRMNAQAADALDATRRAFDAQGSVRGNERFPPARSRRRRRARLPSVSSGGITPRFETVSGGGALPASFSPQLVDGLRPRRLAPRSSIAA
jgi:hypothetical protein